MSRDLDAGENGTKTWKCGEGKKKLTQKRRKDEERRGGKAKRRRAAALQKAACRPEQTARAGRTSYQQAANALRNRLLNGRFRAICTDLHRNPQGPGISVR